MQLRLLKKLEINYNYNTALAKFDEYLNGVKIKVCYVEKNYDGTLKIDSTTSEYKSERIEEYDATTGNLKQVTLYLSDKEYLVYTASEWDATNGRAVAGLKGDVYTRASATDSWPTSPTSQRAVWYNDDGTVSEAAEYSADGNTLTSETYYLSESTNITYTSFDATGRPTEGTVSGGVLFGYSFSIDYQGSDSLAKITYTKAGSDTIVMYVEKAAANDTAGLKLSTVAGIANSYTIEHIITYNGAAISETNKKTEAYYLSDGTVINYTSFDATGRSTEGTVSGGVLAGYSFSIDYQGSDSLAKITYTKAGSDTIVKYVEKAAANATAGLKLSTVAGNSKQLYNRTYNNIQRRCNI